MNAVSMKGGGKRTRLVIVTNIPAPNRLPAYGALATDPLIQLKVIFCSAREPDREWDLGPARFEISDLIRYDAVKIEAGLRVGVIIMYSSVDSNKFPLNEEFRTQRALNGTILHGDDFSLEETAAWFEDEREDYFNLYFGEGKKTAEGVEPYEYSALAAEHGFGRLPHREYDHALGIGSANGAELKPLLAMSHRVTVLEPSDGFSKEDIEGKHVTYVKPLASGIMPFSDSSFDVIVCFNVLHYVPNVSTVVRDMFRVLKPGGYALLREPTHSMGDWRLPRRGLTKRERGIPLAIFRRIISEADFEVVKETRCMFSLVSRLEYLLARPVWTYSWIVKVDRLVCRLPFWPRRYHALRVWQKIRPTAVAYVLSKPLITSQRAVTKPGSEPS